MKKLFLLATVAMTMVACSQNEDVVSPSTSQQRQEVKFQVANYNQTRNPLNLTNTFSPENKIWVYAVSRPTKATTDPYAIFLEHQAFEYAEDSGKAYWRPTDGFGNFSTVLYPFTSKVIFMGFSTTAEHTASYERRENGEISGMTVAFGDQLNGKEDVMYTTAGAVKNNTYQDDVPSLKFAHAMALLQFRFSAGNDQGTSMHITSVKVIDAVKLSGKMNITLDASDNYQVKWSELSNEKSNLTINAETPITLVKNNGKLMDGGILIPTDGTVTVPQNYEVSYYVGDDATNIQTATVQFNSTQKLKNGTKTVMNFTFNPRNVEVTADGKSFGGPEDVY